MLRLGAYLITCWFVVRGYLDTAFALRASVANHKQTKEALDNSESKLRSMLESISDHMSIMDKELNIIWANKTAKEIFGDDIIGKKCYEVYHRRKEPCQPYPCLTLKAFQDGKIHEHDTQVIDKEGKIIYFHCTSNVALKDKNGKPAAVIEISRDITQRKYMENELKVKDNALKTSVNAIGFADLEGKITYVNSSFLKMYGYDNESEVLGKTILKLGFDENAVLESEEAMRNKGGWVSETIVKRKDGSSFDVQISVSMLRDENNKPLGTMASFVDITERKKMGEELQKMQKLESLGVLAGGIAHDFNNLLTAIIGNLSLIELYAKSGGNILEVLEETKRASQQTRRLTQQLLTFSTGGLPIKKGVSITKLLKDTAGLALSGSNVKCEFSLPDDLWWAEVDEGQIDQAINNMIINANQAMPRGGTIRIWAENVVVGAEEGLPLKDGKYVKISIKDQGTGIMEDYLQKIFDPYFTTKQAGSGLGLAITYSIINKHGGHIAVESEIGAGTTFTIFLPAFEKEIFTVKDVEEEQVYKGKGNILFMDDKENIKKMVGSMLNKLGYEVELVGDGAEAIELYKEAKASGQKFDAVILDLTIPCGMGGIEAIKKLHEIDPKIKAIVSSGYSTDPIMSEYRECGFKGAIAKPYEIQKLSETLYKVLNGKEESVST